MPQFVSAIRRSGQIPPRHLFAEGIVIILHVRVAIARRVEEYDVGITVLSPNAVVRAASRIKIPSLVSISRSFFITSSAEEIYYSSADIPISKATVRLPSRGT